MFVSYSSRSEVVGAVADVWSTLLAQDNDAAFAKSLSDAGRCRAQ